MYARCAEKERGPTGSRQSSATGRAHAHFDPRWTALRGRSSSRARIAYGLTLGGAAGEFPTVASRSATEHAVLLRESVVPGDL